MIPALFFLGLSVSLVSGDLLPKEQILCDACANAVYNLEDAVFDENIHASLIGKLNAVCGMVMPSTFEQCTGVVDGLSQKVLHHLLQDMEPTDLCVSMTACPVNMAVHLAPPPALRSLPSDSPECELCELLVRVVDQYLAENSTEAAINATIYNVCNALPDNIKDTCLTFAPQLVSLIAKGVDPKQACTTVKLCTSTGAHVSVRNVNSEMPSDTPVCQLCELLVQAVDQYVAKNSTETTINETVYGMCESLPAEIKAACLLLAPRVVSEIEKGVDPNKTCAAIKLCTSSDTRVPLGNAHVESVSAEPLCEICELLVQAVDQYLGENSTEAAINQTVYNLCNALPDTIKSTCLTMAPLIVTEISKGVDPKEACTTLKLCTSVAVQTHVRRAEPESVSAEPLCEICELLVQVVDQYLGENSTEAAINQTVYNLCNALPDTIKSTCLTMAPLIVTEISKGVDPKEACTTLKLCTSAGIHTSVKRADPERVNNEVVCAVCELLVQYVDQYLEQNSTEAAINDTVYGLCNSLPDNLKSTCLALAPQVVAEITKGADPKQACTSLKLCTSTEDHISPRNVSPERVNNEVVCAVCELLVQYVDQYLEQNSTEAAINETVYGLCNSLPDNLKSTCLTLAPLVVAEITKGADPKQACTSLKLCTSTENEISVRNVETERVNNEVVCAVCELLVQYVDQYLEQNSTEAAINDTVYGLCNSLPDNLKSTCLTLAPQVVAEITKGADPKQACTSLKLCTSTEKRVSLRNVNTERLTAGPLCEICELLVQAVDQYLGENSTEAAINQTVYNLCNALPDTIKSTCLQLAPTIVSEISKGVDPKQACTSLKLCTSQEAEVPVRKVSSQIISETPVCQMCELLVQAVDQYVAKNSTETAINETVYGMCESLPAEIKLACLLLAPRVVSEIEKGVDPNKTCAALKLCTSLGARTVAAQAPVVRDERLCAVCKDHVAIIDRDLYREEPVVQNLLDEICHRLPPPTDQACLTAADTKFPEIFEKFVNGTASADNVCKLLGLCTN